MKPRMRAAPAYCFLLLAVCAGFAPVFSTRAGLWITGYYPGYRQTYLPPSAIDFTALTHIIHFSIIPNSDGSLDAASNGITPSGSAALISQAHAAGVKVLLCVGGASSETAFQGATSPANLATFINNLTNFAGSYSYDGLDIDWEPLPSTDFQQYTNFINSLRAALNILSSPKLLTVAATAYPSYGDSPTAEYTMFASLQSRFDQINVMTYDLSGPYSGWVTWFNAPIFDGGYTFPSTHGLVPSANGAINNFISNGVAASKLAIGLAFYGDIWAGGAGTSTGGATLPRQSWTNAPTLTQDPFYDIMSTYFQSNRYHWDDAAQAAYLSIDNSGSASDKFISYDDEHTCSAKVSYARNRALGGVMIWELGEGYRPTLPAGQRDPLLQAVKSAMATPRFSSVQRSNNDVVLSFTSAWLASYRLLCTSNLNAGAWNTLTTNLNGNGAILQFTDVGALTNQSHRFYRLQTPP
jgi:chitinase